MKLLESGGVVSEAAAESMPAPVPAETASVESSAVPAKVPAEDGVPRPKRFRRPKKPKAPKESTSDIVPHVLALVMLISAVVLPFFFWQEAFTQF